MRHLAAIISAAAIALPLPALAQIETVDPDIELQEHSSEIGSDVIEHLSDPHKQEQLAKTLETLSHVILDLPLEPLAQAIADTGVAAVDEIPADATLRQLAPEAGDVSGEIVKQLPQVMASLAEMAEGMQAMLPALREMADQIEEALPREFTPDV